MRNHPLRAREQTQVRVLTIIAIVMAVGLTWASMYSVSNGNQASSGPVADIAQQR